METLTLLRSVRLLVRLSAVVIGFFATIYNIYLELITFQVIFHHSMTSVLTRPLCDVAKEANHISTIW